MPCLLELLRHGCMKEYLMQKCHMASKVTVFFAVIEQEVDKEVELLST